MHLLVTRTAKEPTLNFGYYENSRFPVRIRTVEGKENV
jgi:hypothetical protein